MIDAMDAAPRDRPILVLAKWHWADGQENPDVSDDYAWRVAEFCGEDYASGGPGWFSCTDNPYMDKAYEPKEWAALPPSPSIT